MAGQLWVALGSALDGMARSGVCGVVANRIGETLPCGDPPEAVNLIVEIPQGGAPGKYEIDTASGASRVGRFCVYTGVRGDRDRSPRLHGQIDHFFGGCEDLEEGEWVEL